MPPWSNTPSGTMRAAVLSKPGASPPSTAFTIDAAYPKPTLPGPDWVLVRVRAAGLNRAELRGRNREAPVPPEFGPFAAECHPEPPAILGEEFVGVVEQAGTACADQFAPGDYVAGFVYGGGKAYDGAYAEYVVAPAIRVWKFDWPGEVRWAAAGAVVMSMWTAYGSLFIAGDSRAGDVVFVHGATSSVGLWAVLLAKAAGCTVLASTRQASKLDRLRAAGADHVLLESDVQEGAVRKLFPGGVRTVLELVGPDGLEKVAIPPLARQGSAVVTGVLSKQWTLERFSPLLIPPTRRLTMYTVMDEDRADVGRVLQEWLDKIRTGNLKAEVFLDKVFPLEEVGKAHEYMEENKAVGKVVLTTE